MSRWQIHLSFVPVQVTVSFPHLLKMNVFDEGRGEGSVTQVSNYEEEAAGFCVNKFYRWED